MRAFALRVHVYWDGPLHWHFLKNLPLIRDTLLDSLEMGNVFLQVVVCNLLLAEVHQCFAIVSIVPYLLEVVTKSCYVVVFYGSFD